MAKTYSREFVMQKKEELKKAKRPTLKQNYKKAECLVEWQDEILSYKNKNWTTEEILVTLQNIAGKDFSFTVDDLENFLKKLEGADTEKKEVEVASQEQVVKTEETVTDETTTTADTEKTEDEILRELLNEENGVKK